MFQSKSIKLLLFLNYLGITNRKGGGKFTFTPRNGLVLLLLLPSILLVLPLSIILRRDVEVNTGPKRNTLLTLLICHCNLNSISAHNFAKSHSLLTSARDDKFDFFFISIDIKSLAVLGYYLTRSDHQFVKAWRYLCFL